MRKNELNEYSELLTQKRANLEREIRNLRTILRGDLEATREIESLDSITANQARLDAVGAIDRLSVTLRLVTEALARLSEGCYGTCPVCGARITERRLLALPWADCCIECAEGQEREGAGVSEAA